MAGTQAADAAGVFVICGHLWFYLVFDEEEPVWRSHDFISQSTRLVYKLERDLL